jgi:hypothetical protein
MQSVLPMIYSGLLVLLLILTIAQLLKPTLLDCLFNRVLDVDNAILLEPEPWLEYEP